MKKNSKYVWPICCLLLAASQIFLFCMHIVCNDPWHQAATNVCLFLFFAVDFYKHWKKARKENNQE